MARIQYPSLKQFFVKKKYRGHAATVVFILYFVFLLCTGAESKVILPKEDAPLCIYSNQVGDDLRLTMKQAIDCATTSIYVAAYSITDELLISSLRRKADEGVRIQVFTDHEASPKDLAHRLGPKIALVRKTKKGLMHHKIICIDDRYIWLGSTNMTRDSMVKHANILVGIHSCELAQFAQLRIDELSSRMPIQKTTAVLPCLDQNITLSFLPYEVQALDSHLKMIANAQKTVRVAIYTFTHRKIIEALLDAHKRGLEVSIVFDRDSSKQTSRLAFAKLKSAGVNVYVNNRAGLLHYKMMIIDDTTLLAGSANFTLAAFTINDDNLLHISPMNEIQKEKINTLWNRIIQDAEKAA